MYEVETTGTLLQSGPTQWVGWRQKLPVARAGVAFSASGAAGAVAATAGGALVYGLSRSVANEDVSLSEGLGEAWDGATSLPSETADMATSGAIRAVGFGRDKFGKGIEYLEDKLSGTTDDNRFD